MIKCLGFFVLFLVFAAGECFAMSDSFKYGANLRIRQEYWGNVFDMNGSGGTPDDNFYRFKTSLWTKYEYSPNFNAYLRLTNEAKYYTITRLADYKNNGFDRDEGVIDNIYVEIKNLFDNKLDLKIGRQDFLGTFGEGFLIMDGTPGDGSRTYFFNAAKASVKFNPAYSVDIVYIDDTKKDNTVLFNNNTATPKYINACDETAAVLYGRMKINDNILLEPYFINKVEDSITSKLNLNTLGARFVHTMDPWKFRAELALQSGENSGALTTKRTGTGGYAFLTRSFKETTFSPEVEAGVVYLSGDDCTTADNESFDPLFSRWPWLSELYILTYASETGIAGYWTNLTFVRLPQVKLQFTKDTSFIGSYNILKANQKTAGLSAAVFSNDGTDRGQLLMATVKHVYNKNISGYLMVERFTPGSFYKFSDPATFFRWNVDLKF